MSLMRSITESGVEFGRSKTEKRSVVLSNYISIVISVAPLALIAGRYFAGTLHFEVNAFLIFACCAFFALPVFLNSRGYIFLSRMILSWVPPLSAMFIIIYGLKTKMPIEPADFVGLRFFLLGFCSLPFLVFPLQNPRWLLVGLLVPIGCLTFFDPILHFFGVGFFDSGFQGAGYAFNNVRIYISLVIIGFSFFFLKMITEQSEELNERLVEELAEKNRLMKQQAAEEVHQLNQQLRANLQHLTEREFILNQSQRVARIGSWEYHPSDGSLIWSDEMYNIFGIEKTYDLKLDTLSKILSGDARAILDQAIRDLLKTNQPFDLTLNTRTPLGYTKWFRIHAFPINEGQAAQGVTGICHDITFYKEAEEKLRSSEVKFSRAFENNPDFIMLVREQDLLVVDVNKRITGVLGFEKAEVIGRSARDMDLFLNEEERQRFIRHYDEHDHYTAYECLWKRKDGRIIQVRITATRIIIEAQFYRLSVVQDVTEQKAAEEKFTKAFDLSPDLMLIFRESDMVLVEANRKIGEVSGFDRGEIIGKNATQVGFEIWAVAEERKKFFSEYFAHGTVFQEAQLRKKGGSFFYATVSAQRIILSGENHMIVVIRDISERREVEKEKEYARFLLNERVKELTVLYRASQILHDKQRPVPEIVKDVVSALPSAWLHSDIAAARIRIENIDFTTHNFGPGVHRQETQFTLPDGGTGRVEVVYLEEREQRDEGPFVKEERTLLNMLGEMLQSYFEAKHEAEALKKSEANLNATINNTEVLIWSVDLDYRLITYNRAFYNYMKSRYNIEVAAGQDVLPTSDSPIVLELNAKWKERYIRALAGEIVTLEENRFDLYFQYSLSPIIEQGKVIGVSIFADDVTDRKIRDRELAEANKKIGEMKLMALRSVMNPHFVFNVLNSIQYFIAKNDRLNAINYLSTFSKLIRSILTHSVNNKIKLGEEIEMLKNYVNLEMTRFENKFDFEMIVEEDVDIDNIEIPSLLVQPYVENAILHGLYNKQEKGLLTIRVLEKGEAVVFEIEDDGIGRQAAMKLRQQSFPTHKSMGIKLTEERLKLINEHLKVAFEVEDLVDAEGHPAGTKVAIWVTA